MSAINFLRHEIEKIDRTIIENIAKRQELIIQIGELKKAQGLPIVDLDREKKQFELYYEWALLYNIPKHLVDDLFQPIIDCSKKTQTKSNSSGVGS